MSSTTDTALSHSIDTPSDRFKGPLSYHTDRFKFAGLFSTRGTKRASGQQRSRDKHRLLFTHTPSLTISNDLLSIMYELDPEMSVLREIYTLHWSKRFSRTTILLEWLSSGVSIHRVSSCTIGWQFPTTIPSILARVSTATMEILTSPFMRLVYCFSYVKYERDQWLPCSE